MKSARASERHGTSPIIIDDRLMREAMRVTGLTTKRAVVEEALRLLVQVRAQAGIRRLRGKGRNVSAERT